MTDELKAELVQFVLDRTPVHIFNKGIREFSCQAIYSHCKRELKQAYPDLMPTDLRYSTKMVEAFKEYEVPEIECKEMEREMRRVRKMAVSRHLPELRKKEYRSIYNELVDQFNEMIQPQQKLRRLYKRIHNRVVV